MLRSVVIDNNMLLWLADKINDHNSKNEKITRKILANLIWEYEKGKR